MKKCLGVLIMLEKEMTEPELEDFMEKIEWIKGVFKVKKSKSKTLWEDDLYDKADTKFTRWKYNKKMDILRAFDEEKSV